MSAAVTDTERFVLDEIAAGREWAWRFNDQIVAALETKGLLISDPANEFFHSPTLRLTDVGRALVKS